MSSNNFLRRLIILMIAVVLPFLSFSQWDSIYYNPNFIFTKVFAQNKDTVFVIGYGGLLLKTTNGGSSWDQISLPVNNSLFDIAFASPLTGYLCGAGGIVLKTTNGGNNWTQCITNTTLHLRTICLVDDNAGWFGGSSSDTLPTYYADSGIIIKTINGGNDFQVEKQFIMGVETIRCINSDTCFAIGNGADGNSVYVYRTINSGATWQNVYAFNTDHPLTSMVPFPSGRVLISWREAYFLESEDFGNSWTFRNSEAINQIYELSFPSSNIGYAVGYSYISKSMDGGYNWDTQNFGYFRSISMVNGTIGYSVTDDGKVFKTNNGGSLLGIHSTNRSDNSGIYVNPNPFTTSLNIKIENKLLLNIEKPIVVEIYSTNGEMVFHKEFFISDIRLADLTNLRNGLYNILIRNGGKIIFNQKLVKIE